MVTKSTIPLKSSPSPIGIYNTKGSMFNLSLIDFKVLSKLAPALSILLIKANLGIWNLFD